MHKAMTAEEAFRQAEASCLLSGGDPNDSPGYREVKALVIAGELSIDEAIQRTVTYNKVSASERI